MTFSEMTVANFLDALASPDPTPGGGTAAAVAGAMGASLLVMVTGLAKSNTNTELEKAALAGARRALQPLAATLAALADADAAAFDQVMGAYRLPKVTDDEKAARSAAIQQALQGATTVPLQTLRACAGAMAQAGTVAACGNRSATSDVGVAIDLLEAAAAGAEANVRINLGNVRDQQFTSSASDETGRLIAEVARQATVARARLIEGSPSGAAASTAAPTRSG
jgi:formiminotetrahydrofolate cyclodeaminase